jgi:pyrroloquinoline quinone biosynthesis protein D
MDTERLADMCPSIRAPYRLQWEEAQSSWVMLYPEGMVKLSPSAGEIMKRCEGRLTVTELIAQLETLFQASQISHDVVSFLTMANQQGWVRLRNVEARPPA